MNGSETDEKPEFEVISNEVLHLSGVRNCQMITMKDNVASQGKEKDEHLIFINLHLHNPMEDVRLGDYVRQH